MRVLVTGGAGFIGQAVARQLAERGDEAVGFDSPNDVRDRDGALRAVWQVDAVINLAGILGTSETFGAEAEVVAVNVLGALSVADACRTAGVPLVQIGTGHRGQLNPYAITKACAEDLLLARAEWQGDPINVVRAFHAYGPGQKACPPHGPAKVRKIVPSFVCRALTGMPLEVNGDGSQVIDLIHVDEVAKVLIAALAGPYGLVLDAGTGTPTTVLDAARDVIDACGSTSEIVHVPMRPGEPEHATIVAERPCSDRPWPWRLDETIDHYAGILAEVAA